MSELAQLLLPAVRWDASRGFDGEREGVDRALALGVGGLIIFGGPREQVARLVWDARERSKIPLLIGADLERGAGQQFTGATGLPPLAALAALGENDALRRAARLTATEARAMGINWIYGPVCDVDIEPENPIVGTRALGGDPARVAELAAEWIDACQAAGVMACAKHFPGHGRTTADSHVETPRVSAPADVMYATDLVPFRAAVDAGVAAVMTAHVSYPALDASGAPATLSRTILRSLLRDQMGFEGLVVTDAFIMEGVLAGGGEGAAAVRALGAGCDLILYPADLAGVLRAVQKAVDDGTLDGEEIHRSLQRRRRWAEWVDTASITPTETAESDLQWSAMVAMRTVHMVRGQMPSLRGRADVLVVDDDLGGPYPPPSREPFVAGLREAGVETRVVERATGAGAGESRVPLLVALFGDIRGWKGRPGYSAGTREAVAAAVAAAKKSARDVLIVQFSHPRLAAELPAAVSVLSAWGGERVMQAAAARVVAGEGKGAARD